MYKCFIIIINNPGDMILNPFDDVALNPTLSRTYTHTPLHCKLNLSQCDVLRWRLESLKYLPPVSTAAAYLRNSL